MTKRTGKRDGRPADEAIRWNLQLAQREFGVHREQLDRRRRALVIEPGEDGCYTSRDIAAMLFGDKEAETVGKIAAERRGQELKNELTVGELIPTAVAARLAEVFLVPVRQRILSSSLTDEEKSEMLADLVRFGEVDWKAEAKQAVK